MNTSINCQQKLNYHYQNPELLETALIHRSYLNEDKNIKQSNERLEYLGDAVLELITSDFLYREFPNEPEGYLTATRAKIVQTKTLAQVANRCELGDYLKLSKGEAASGGNKNESILADLVEAIIGSIYLDGGIEAAKKFIHDQILSDFESLIENAQVQDFKSKLQELVQAKGGIAPTYQVVKEEGPDHDRTFTVQVFFFDEPQSVGMGKSKQTAQQNAARKALEKFNKLD
ncbi:ribonuclease III [Candidatus Beckwithbacteria bacterium]|nr:ribonuclease III [Candidatus Beckwithbacteria bacterium]